MKLLYCAIITISYLFASTTALAVSKPIPHREKSTCLGVGQPCGKAISCCPGTQCLEQSVMQGLRCTKVSADLH